MMVAIEWVVARWNDNAASLTGWGLALLAFVALIAGCSA